MKYAACILFLALTIISWGKIIISIQQDQSSFQSYVSEAEKYEENEVYVRAIASYRKALGYDQTNKEIQTKIMKLYEKMGDDISYCQYNLSLIEQYPSDIDFYLNLLAYYKEHSGKKLIQFLLSMPDNLLNQEQVMPYYQYAKSQYSLQQMQYQDMSDFLFGYSRITQETTDEDGQPVTVQYVCNVSGEPLFEEDGYASVSPVGATGQFLVRNQDGEWKIVDTENYTLAQRKDKGINEIGLFTYIYAAAVVEGKNSYINAEFKVADMSEYDEILPFSQGFSAVKKDGKYALLNEQLSVISDFQYDEIVQDSFGRPYWNDRFIVKENNQYYFINASNEKVSEQSFEDAKMFADSQPTAVQSNGKWGFANSGGEIYMECKYEDAMPYSNGYAAVKENGLWGYIDSSGDYIIKPQFIYAGNMTKEGKALVKTEDGLYSIMTYDFLAYQKQEEE